MLLKKILVAVFLAATSLTFGNAYADDAAKQKDIAQLLQVTGSLQIADQMATAVIQQMSQAMKQADPNISDAAIKIVGDETVAFMREKVPGLVAQMLPLYGQHFSHDEIKQLLAFYDTELGRKTIQVMPQLAQQSIMISQQYLQTQMPELQQRITSKLQQAGFN